MSFWEEFWLGLGTTLGMLAAFGFAVFLGVWYSGRGGR